MVERPPTPSISRQVVAISPKSNVTIKVLDTKNKQGQRLLTSFKAKREALASSEYFKASLRFNTAYNHKIQLKDDDAGAIQIWRDFRLFGLSLPTFVP
jgi:hypothetical protein